MTTRAQKRTAKNAEACADLAPQTLAALDAAQEDPKIVSFGDKVHFLHNDAYAEWRTCDKLPDRARDLMADICTRADSIEALHQVLHIDESHISLTDACEGIEYKGLNGYHRDLMQTAIVMLMKDLQRDLSSVFDLAGGKPA